MAEEKKANAAPAKAVTAVKKDENQKLGFFQRIKKWFRDMKSELKKVIWPTSKQLTKNSVIAIVAMVISGIGIWCFDEIAQLLIRALFTLVG